MFNQSLSTVNFTWHQTEEKQCTVLVEPINGSIGTVLILYNVQVCTSYQLSLYFKKSF